MKKSTFDQILSNNLAVVCHDAGAANIIVDWLKEASSFRVKACMSGPSASIWSEAFPTSPIHSLEDALSDCTSLLTGTGWSSDIEHSARLIASSKEIFSVAVIDHWVNYSERFSRNGTLQLPDVICVTDEYAYHKVKKIMPGIKLYLMENTYLKRQVKAISTQTNSNLAEESVLYVLEPIRVKWKYEDSRSGEFQALDFFMDNLHKIVPDGARIRIRPHPSDSKDKYRKWVSRQNIKVEISEGYSLAQDISWRTLLSESM